MKKLLVIFISIFILSFFFWWTHGNGPMNSKEKKQITFTVAKGQGLKETAKKLQEAGLIADWFVFYLVAKNQDLDTKLQAGDFTLSPSMSASDIAEALTHSNADMRITIPEGKRAEEIADMLEARLPGFQEAWRTTLDENEGYLFPDTYSFQKETSIEDIVSVMRKNFDEKYATLSIPSQKYTQHEIVTIASLIEREAKIAEDRPMVASVIFNRLAIGMPLQIDATVQYALGYQSSEKTWWKKNLTFKDLELRSAYNTYTNTGLPPTPISNPGLDVLNATIHPANTQYLYYISDKQGNNHYAKTFEEHNANIKKFGL